MLWELKEWSFLMCLTLYLAPRRNSFKVISYPCFPLSHCLPHRPRLSVWIFRYFILSISLFTYHLFSGIKIIFCLCLASYSFLSLCSLLLYHLGSPLSSSIHLYLSDMPYHWWQSLAKTSFSSLRRPRALKDQAIFSASSSVPVRKKMQPSVFGLQSDGPEPGLNWFFHLQVVRLMQIHYFMLFLSS